MKRLRENDMTLELLSDDLSAFKMQTCVCVFCLILICVFPASEFTVGLWLGLAVQAGLGALVAVAKIFYYAQRLEE